VLQIDGNNVSQIPDSGLSWSLSSTWFISNKKYYIAGDGIYPSRTLGPIWQRDASFPAIYKDAVRGSGFNDIVVSGSNGLLSHYNGATWKHYINKEIPFFYGRLYSVAIKGNLTVAVGQIDNKGVAIMGRR
jgi:hypothetical protein